MSAELELPSTQIDIWTPGSLPSEIGKLDIFRFPKDPERPEQYEDEAGFKFFPRSRKERQLALAVADGATEAVLSDVWAKALVKSFVKRPAGRRYGLRSDWWETAREEFKEGLDISKLPWYAVEKLAKGSFATFGGITLYWPERQYSVAGYGDVVIAISAQDAVTIYPDYLQGSSDFNNRPTLVGTLSRPQEQGGLKNRRNLPNSGCSIYLMTDAIGAWFVEQLSTSPSATIDQMEEFDASNFAAFVQEARVSKSMRTDDVALIRLRLT